MSITVDRRGNENKFVSGVTLPSWIYASSDFYEIERRTVFDENWHWVCHVSDIPYTGDFVSLDVCEEPILAIRGHDMHVRVFSNVCRHRAARLVDTARGHCDRLLTCPYHAWSYDLMGRLVGVPGEAGFGGVPRAEHALRELEVETYLGFVFARFAAGGSSVASLLAPWHAELAAYRTEEMVPIAPIVSMPIDADWKILVENDLEGYHVPASHPGLLDLIGSAYPVEACPNGTSRIVCPISTKPARQWTVRHYQALLARMTDVDPALAGVYRIYRAFPNWGFDCFPEQVMTTQFVPIGPGRSVLRGGCYALPTGDRVWKAAQLLNLRLQQQVADEDTRLAESVQRGLRSRHYGGGILGAQERALAHFHALIRARIPLTRSPAPPTSPGS
jgi:phenylpropionate dioxygenase-like ring-hydroxylating dioxygenase large terminal subunit